MADWVMTATTIYCDAVDDEVTLIINRDGTSKCTGYNKYGQPGKETARTIKIKSKQSGKQLKCEGPECHRVTRYRDKLLSEEAEAGGSGSRE